MKPTIFIFFCFIAFTGISQNEEINLEEFAERLFQVQDENISYEDIYESLLLLYSDKINLNKTDPNELSSLYILSFGQINSFFDHIEKNGKLLSINELQTIENFDLETIRAIQPFVSVKESAIDSRPFFRRILTEENNYLLFRYSTRLEEQLGYTKALPVDTFFIQDENEAVIDTVTSPPPRYNGSQHKLYGRFRTSHKGDFSLGFTFEKDPGERFEFKGGQSGFDFYSYHLLLENKLGLDKIVVGDYQLQVGQGLIFGAGFASGKGAETVNAVKRNTLGISPYTSVLESGFFRGIGVAKSIGDFEITLFYSDLKQDGNIRTSNFSADQTELEEQEFVNSIQKTGFHRTNGELAIKDQVAEESIGATIEFKPNRRLTIGISGLNTNYSVPLQKRPNNYNQFEFNGDHNYIASSNVSYSWQNFSFFGEAARSKSGGIGAIGGFVASLSPTIDMGFLLRRYDRDFHSFYGNALSENSRTINENGTYWGMQIRPNRRHKLNAYYDKFAFPWLKFRTEAPSDGHEYLLRYTYNPSRQISLYAQIRQQIRQISVANENVNSLQEQQKRNYIFNVDYQLKSGLDLKTKVQSSTVDQGESFTKGIAIVQDVNFQICQLKFYTRMALFDADDFNNAQYVYENDVLYAFSIPAYIGTGIRNYVMVRYDPFRNTSLWVRYSRTEFKNTTETSMIGSSLDQTLGDTASEIKIMARFKF